MTAGREHNVRKDSEAVVLVVLPPVVILSPRGGIIDVVVNHHTGFFTLPEESNRDVVVLCRFGLETTIKSAI